MKKMYIVLLIFSACSLLAQERFTSNEYNFAITFPKDWEVKTNNKSYIVEAFENNYIGISISVLRQPRLPDSLNISYISKDSLQKIIMAQIEKQYNKAIILHSGTGLMDGAIAYYYFVQYSDYKDGYPDKFVSFQYQFLYKTVFYSIFAVCPASQYESYEKTFNDIYKTFRFIKKI